MGLGFEKQLDDARWSLKSEYICTAIQTHEVAGFANGGGNLANIEFDPSSHVTKFGVTYRFGNVGT